MTSLSTVCPSCNLPLLYQRSPSVTVGNPKGIRLHSDGRIQLKCSHCKEYVWLTIRWNFVDAIEAQSLQ